MNDFNKKYDNLSQMGQAISDHDEVRISTLGKSAQKLSSDENAIVLIANGYNGNDLDQFHAQDEKRIALVLKATSEAGIDINKSVDGEPASHFLTKHYVNRKASAEYDTSMASLNGMTDRNQMEYLKTFAQNGVDFLQRDSKAQGFVNVGEKALENFAIKHEPKTMKEDYEPAYDGDKMRYKFLKSIIKEDLLDVKKEAQSAKINSEVLRKDIPKKAVSKSKDQNEL